MSKLSINDRSNSFRDLKIFLDQLDGVELIEKSKQGSCKITFDHKLTSIKDILFVIHPEIHKRGYSKIDTLSFRDLRNTPVFTYALKLYNKEWRSKVSKEDICFLLAIQVCSSKAPDKLTEINMVSRLLKDRDHSQTKADILKRLNEFIHYGCILKIYYKKKTSYALTLWCQFQLQAIKRLMNEAKPLN